MLYTCMGRTSPSFSMSAYRKCILNTLPCSEKETDIGTDLVWVGAHCESNKL